MARPTDFTPEIADKICGQLSAGVSLRTVCLADDLPSTVTVFSWLRKFPEFLNQYEKAKAECADAYAEEIIDIADDGTNDWMERNDKDGENIGWQLNGEHVQRSRLRIDSRKWIASKLKPKKYGEKSTQEISGPDGGPISTSLAEQDRAILNRYLIEHKKEPK